MLEVNDQQVLGKAEGEGVLTEHDDRENTEVELEYPAILVPWLSILG